MVTLGPSSNLTSYSYDAMERLRTVSGALQQTYTYDVVGNRLSRAQTTGTNTYTYASTSNRLLSYTGPSGRTLTYDATGNLRSDGLITYTYDARRRLTRASNAAFTATYQVNGLGQRVAKTVVTATASTTRHFVYDLQGQLLGEYDGSGALQWEVVYLGSMPVAVLTNTGDYDVQTDHLHAPRALLDAQRRVVWRWVPDPFGVGAERPDPDGDGVQVHFGLRFPGQYFDDETGLHYNYFRDYDPQIGRYLSPDPIGFAGGDVTLYGYVSNNPVNWIDPTGLRALAGALPTGAAFAAADGPLPFGDLIGGGIIAAAGIYEGWQWWQQWSKETSEADNDPVVYPHNPDTHPEKFSHRKDGSKVCNDRSVWQRDHSSHGGPQWKRWDNDKDYAKGRKPTSVWPDGRIRK